MKKLITLDTSLLETFSNSPKDILTADTELQISVATHPDTPRNVLEVLASSEKSEVAEAAQMHVNYSGELTEAWQDAVEDKLKSRYLGQNDKLAVELLKIAPLPVYFLSEYVPPEYLIQGVNNSYLSKSDRIKLLARLAKEPTLEPRLQVAESTDTPVAILEQLIGDLDLSIRIAVEYNPNCPPELVDLVKGQHQVASNWDTNSQQLDYLSSSNWDWIRLAIAQNPSASEETLLKLAGDKVFKIQLAVAKNPVTPPKILAVLAEHSSKEIQAEVAKHPNATEEILHSLFDRQQSVIKSRDNLPASILEKIFSGINKNTASSSDHNVRRVYISLRSYLLRQLNTPTQILAEFTNIDIEKLTAEKFKKEQQRGSTPGIHKQWVSDELKFLINIANHPQVSVEIIEKIVQYPNLGIKLAATENQKIPEDLKLRLLEELTEEEIDDKIKAKIAAKTNTPSQILEKLANKLSSISSILTKLGQIIPNASQPLIDKIIDFIDRYQSPEQILFWLRQDEAFRKPILEDWQEVIDSLEETEIQQLKAMAMMMMPAIGLSGGVPRQDRVWLSQGLENSRINQADFLQNLPPIYKLYGLLMLIGISHQNDHGGKAIVTALLGNPSTPASIRDRLWERYREKSEDNRRVKDASLRLALGFNPAILEDRRKEYLEQALSSGYNNIREAIAKNPLTSAEILERIANRGVGGLQQVVKNPNCPVHLLKQAVEQIENSSGLSHTLVEVAKNPNTPLVLLKELALSKSSYGVAEAVLKNPNLDLQSIYEIQLTIQKKKEIQQVNQILAKRTDSPYTLAKVLETGDQNAKLLAARNRKTPIKVLEQLAKDEDETIRQAVAQNLSISQEIAQLLAGDKSIKVQLSLLRSKINLSPSILHQLAQNENPSIRLEIAKNKNTPPIILRYLVCDKKCQIEILKNPATPADILAEYVPKITNEKQIESILRGTNSTQQKNPNMPSEILEQLSHHSKNTIRYLVALYPTASATTLKRLASDSYPLVRQTVAENPSTPPDVLLEMAKAQQNQITSSVGSAHSVAFKLAGRKDISAEALDWLVKMPVPIVRLAAVRNNNISLQTLDWLVDNNMDENVLSIIAQNENIPPQMQEKLATNSSIKVRQSLASNPNVTSDVLSIIYLTIITTETNPEILIAVASHPNTPIEFIKNLSEAENPFIRVGVARNPKLPQNLIEKLVKDESLEVRHAVANNNNSSARIKELLKDLLPVVKINTQSQTPTLRGLSRIYNPDTDDLPTVLSEYINSEVPLVRFVALLHPSIPREILSEATNSTAWIERYAVANNPNTPTEIKQQLSQDSNQIVRACAVDNLVS